jgi:hypothetical protein
MTNGGTFRAYFLFLIQDLKYRIVLGRKNIHNSEGKYRKSVDMTIVDHYQYLKWGNLFCLKKKLPP